MIEITRQDAKNAKRIRGKRYLASSASLREQIMRIITRQDAKNAKRIRGKRYLASSASLREQIIASLRE